MLSLEILPVGPALPTRPAASAYHFDSRLGTLARMIGTIATGVHDVAPAGGVAVGQSRLQIGQRVADGSVLRFRFDGTDYALTLDGTAAPQALAASGPGAMTGTCRTIEDAVAVIQADGPEGIPGLSATLSNGVLTLAAKSPKQVTALRLDGWIERWSANVGTPTDGSVLVFECGDRRYTLTLEAAAPTQPLRRQETVVSGSFRSMADMAAALTAHGLDAAFSEDVLSFDVTGDTGRVANLVWVARTIDASPAAAPSKDDRLLDFGPLLDTLDSVSGAFAEMAGAQSQTA